MSTRQLTLLLPQRSSVKKMINGPPASPLQPPPTPTPSPVFASASTLKSQHGRVNRLAVQVVGAFMVGIHIVLWQFASFILKQNVAIYLKRTHHARSTRRRLWPTHCLLQPRRMLFLIISIVVCFLWQVWKTAESAKRFLCVYSTMKFHSQWDLQNIIVSLYYFWLRTIAVGLRKLRRETWFIVCYFNWGSH